MRVSFSFPGARKSVVLSLLGSSSFTLSMYMYALVVGIKRGQDQVPPVAQLPSCPVLDPSIVMCLFKWKMMYRMGAIGIVDARPGLHTHTDTHIRRQVAEQQSNQASREGPASQRTN